MFTRKYSKDEFRRPSRRSVSIHERSIEICPLASVNGIADNTMATSMCLTAEKTAFSISFLNSQSGVLRDARMTKDSFSNSGYVAPQI